jgi:hypothetical protein
MMVDQATLANVFWFTLAAYLTLSIFSFLYKDNPFYRLAEHLIVGLSAGYWIAILWHTSLKDLWLYPLVDNSVALFSGDFRAVEIWRLSLNVIPGVLGLFMFLRFFPKIGWLSRWPIAFYLAISAGVSLPLYLQSFTVEQMRASMIPLTGNPWEIVCNLIVIAGTICGLAYFYFSMEHKGLVGGMAKFGVWVLMIGFGSTFGYTVMSRISLLIGRFRFLIDWCTLVVNYFK